MCDYCADAVWNIDGQACSPEDLPISSGLIAQLREWQAFYDDFAPTDSRVHKDWNVERFSSEGLKLARAVKGELSDWTVVYFDEARAGPVALDSPRSAFEYEVEL